MGLFTFNYNKIYLASPPAQSEHGPEHRPLKNNENKATFFEVFTGVAISHYIDPYLNGVRVMVGQAIELFGVSTVHASTASEILCFTMVCAAPTIIRRVLRSFLN
ncbi:hypothetical protein [Pantoea agglomerans]